MARVSSGTLTVFVFALLIGLGGAYIVRQQMNKPQVARPTPEAAAAPGNITIPVASVSLTPGREVTMNEIAVISLTPEAYAKSVYAKIPYMRDSRQFMGRVLKTEIKQGDAFLTTSFYPDGSGPGIAELLKPGYRGVSIPIEDVAAVYGFARPGSFVDVLFRSEETEDRTEVTMTLLERVQILAVKHNTLSDQSVELSSDGTVTLAVTPSQAKVLKVVEGRGMLSLTLRNPDDESDIMPVDLNSPDAVRATAGLLKGTTPVRHGDTATGRSPSWWLGQERVLAGTDQVSLDDLLGRQPKPKPVQMEVWRGASRHVIEFGGTERVEDPQMISRPLYDTPMVGNPPSRRLPRRMPVVTDDRSGTYRQN